MKNDKCVIQILFAVLTMDVSCSRADEREHSFYGNMKYFMQQQCAAFVMKGRQRNAMGVKAKEFFYKAVANGTMKCLTIKGFSCCCYVKIAPEGFLEKKNSITTFFPAKLI